MLIGLYKSSFPIILMLHNPLYDTCLLFAWYMRLIRPSLCNSLFVCTGYRSNTTGQCARSSRCQTQVCVTKNLRSELYTEIKRLCVGTSEASNLDSLFGMLIVCWNAVCLHPIFDSWLVCSAGRRGDLHQPRRVWVCERRLWLVQHRPGGNEEGDGAPGAGQEGRCLPPRR